MKLNFGILGLNARNLLYIKKFNPQKQIHFVTNKYKTKEFLRFRGIPVPKTLFYIKSKKELFDIDFSSFLSKSFVVKPNKGSGGNGIFLIKDIRPHQKVIKNKINLNINLSKFNNIFNKKIKFDKKNIISKIFKKLSDIFFEESISKTDLFIGKKRIPDFEFKKEIVSILDGLYRIGDNPDHILIEEILKPSENYKEFCQYGLADIRVICCNLVPISAMIRIPTKKSGGKANLAQGGIACGLNIIDGTIETIFTGKGGKSYTKSFPKKFANLKGKKIEFRDEILQHSANAQYFLNIGYMGIDRVITDTGPKVLEINGRSGIEIQNITQTPLRHFMEKIQDLKINSPMKGLEISKSLFFSEESSNIPTEQIIYLSQPANISWIENQKTKTIDLIAIINTKNKKSYISPKLFKKLGQQSKSKLKINLIESKINTDIKVYESSKVYGNKITLGKDFLQNYLIKPIEKTPSKIYNFSTKKIFSSDLDELQLFDKKISDLSKKVSLQSCLKPINYFEELDNFIEKKGNYNPSFQYKYPTKKRLDHIKSEIDLLENKKYNRESPFAKLLKDKFEEIKIKFELINAYKNQDLKNISKYNQELFKEISSDLYSKAINICSKQKNIKSGVFGEVLSFYEIYHRISNYLTEKKLKTKIEKNSDMLSRISIGYKNNEAFIKLLANSRNKMRTIELESKLVHEIDVHLSRFINGKKSGWFILQQGTAGYISDEEGLAIFQAEKKMQEFIPQFENINIRRNYLYIRQSQFSNFKELGNFINKYENYNYKGNENKYMNLFNRVLKFKKGIENTKVKHPGAVYYKDKVYLEGYLKIKKYFEEKGKLENLMIGKIKIDDIKYIL